MTTLPYILAIDTSCDETAASVVCGTIILSNVIASQVQLHKQYGGVFPTVAKQAHKENIDPVIRAALRKAGIEFKDVVALAVTQGPGLAPALEIGIEKAKQLAQTYNLPLIPINHIEGHALSILAEPLSKKLSLTEQYAQNQQRMQKQQFPALAMIISGKHTDLVLVENFGNYTVLGQTVDDAAGEALDKFGRMVDLGYPAGPMIEEFAKLGDPKSHSFPLPMTTSGDFNMSFSGLKTSARNLTQKLQQQHAFTKQNIYDLCASFQWAVFRAITYKLGKVLEKYTFSEVWLGGGVSSNTALRQAVRQKIKAHHLQLRTPYTKRLCADNAAMIGVVASLKYQRNDTLPPVQGIERVPRLELSSRMGT